MEVFASVIKARVGGIGGVTGGGGGATVQYGRGQEKWGVACGGTVAAVPVRRQERVSCYGAIY